MNLHGMDLKGMDRYHRFGLRRIWLEHFFEHKENCFTMGSLGNAKVKGVDPVSIFGINPDRFKNILRDISLQFDKYIRTTFVADLDNVQLFPKYKSLDILELIAK